MTPKASFLKTVLVLTAALYLSGLFVPGLVPKAHALYWEDDNDEGNNPNETKSRPSHFGLFDWVGDAQNDSKKQHYKDMDNRDRGPTVNGGRRAGVVIVSGLAGLGLGAFLGYEFTPTGNDPTADIFIGGAIGLGTGVLIGATIMPGDYNVDQHARIDYLKQRQAWLDDPIQTEVRKTFHPTPVAMKIQF
jgi:hypothetical protein